MVQLSRPSPGVITSGFGARTGGFHEGIDFGWGNGWTIYAAAAGVVRHSGPGGAYGARYGNLTIIDHAGFQTRYAHQSRIDVRVGQTVAAGQAIGVIGGSGAKGSNTYAPHLHFELVINGSKVNAVPHFTAPAGGNVTPIPKPKPKEEDDMDFGYFTRVNPTTKKDEWALTHPLIFTDGVFITGDISIANGFAPYTRTSASLTDDRWAGMIKTAKLVYDAAWAAEAKRAALTPSGGSSIGGPTAAEIAAETIRQMKLPGN